MSETKVVNKYHKVPYDVYIGRGSIWGNPFVIGKDGDRDDVIRKYAEWIKAQPQLLNRLHELKGKTLCCFCKPKACHGDILAELADNLAPESDECP
ncbi:DUF4326 domain-containing protein [Paenibacillus spiritus]|uniref:DUF4326 domain-containing protein n=1 Tax=Paenibacillus spiritus TaxID=2496557 RepID=A0A5J5GGS9_9BACL|nr:DUF4326 domain-containing protein [Paenibacillus spiritus]KAA9007297.1 DUF4326 domain-containing protein [Paenibacillus spiritus]